MRSSDGTRANIASGVSEYDGHTAADGASFAEGTGPGDAKKDSEVGGEVA